jgi:hypothetical protein
MTPLWRRGRLHPVPILVSNLPAESISLSPRGRRLGAGSAILIGVSVMQIDHPQRSKRRGSEPSLWADEPTDEAIPLLENALREDEPGPCGGDHNDDVHWLRQENARLRQLLAERPDPIR